jgi:23S rRNA (cytidine1920-2'-O)/16S rRNA (cytidine1409-2'-O)-methyltransferase
LQRGARKVYCIDVGYGQLAWSLRNDPRVVVMERTNIRYIDSVIEEHPSKFSGEAFNDLLNRKIDMATLDVSFISLTKVMPAVLKFLRPGGEVLALVKPQFEVGKGEVGKGGIVREEEKRLEAVSAVREDLERLGLETVGVVQSSVPGQKGNIEYFLYMKKEG